ncbi:MAG: 50S ribosomal protein L4, partial [Pseudomonadota bacterium]|nr:50S ribosomal protein L4 [Pseudomonadota bacterium]
GDIELADEIFGADVRKDLLARMVNYQLAKRRAGTHKTKGMNEVRGTTAKPWRQKGSGRARAGSVRAPHWRGGGTVFGPVVRSHAHKLPKRVRRLAMKSALSSKQAEGKLVILKDASLQDAKTRSLLGIFEKLGWSNALIVGVYEIDDNFERAARNIPNVDVLPSAGANVYDILRRDVLVLTTDAVEALEARLK